MSLKVIYDNGKITNISKTMQATIIGSCLLDLIDHTCSLHFFTTSHFQCTHATSVDWAMMGAASRQINDGMTCNRSSEIDEW